MGRTLSALQINNGTRRSHDACLSTRSYYKNGTKCSRDVCLLTRSYYKNGIRNSRDACLPTRSYYKNGTRNPRDACLPTRNYYKITEQNVHVTFAHLHEPTTTTATEQDFRVTFTYTRLINETGRSRDVFLPTRSYFKKNDMLSGITCGTKYSLPLSLSPVWGLRSRSLIEKFELWNIWREPCNVY
jgi:hypothetical protein